MKILYLTYPKHDYQADQVYTGLCKLLGWENIIDFPYKPHYHDPSFKVPSLPQNPGRLRKLEEIITGLEAKEYDLLVLSTTRQETVETLNNILQKMDVPPSVLPPRVLMDGDDHWHMREDLFKLFRLSLYFKREYRLSWAEGPALMQWAARRRAFGGNGELYRRTFPLPFSINLETVPHIDRTRKDLDLSFVGLISNRNRIKAVNFLKTVRDIRFEGWVYAEPTDRKSKLAVGSFAILKEKIKGDPRISEAARGVKLSYQDYFHLLQRSKFALSLAGSGFDTLRYWEIVASKVLLISEKPFIFIPNNFEDKKHVLFCRSDCRDVPGLIKAYGRDDSAREQCIEAAYQHLLRFHTCERRAMQFLEVCHKRI
jgi:hypothetical protein